MARKYERKEIPINPNEITASSSFDEATGNELKKFK